MHVPKVREAIKLIEADGWREVATKGSHRQFKHPTKTGRVTIAGHHRTTWRQAILKQAGLKG
ncbi:MAG: type II toxin-antitoxin system HicA family toxin [Acidobacteriota bacterium]|nr:type II toxin-antitoxin system HicA family toxin [Acidobacteriota bacterium]